MPPSDPQFEQKGFKQVILPPRTPQQQSWGTILSLILIVAMIVVGAFYAWGKRIAEQQALQAQVGTTTISY